MAESTASPASSCVDHRVANSKVSSSSALYHRVIFNYNTIFIKTIFSLKYCQILIRKGANRGLVLYMYFVQLRVLLRKGVRGKLTY